MKKCPYCAEEIQDEAIKCRHCKSDLTQANTQTNPSQNEISSPKKEKRRFFAKPQVVVEKYPKTVLGSLQRKGAEARMEKRGYYVYAVEDVKQYSAGKGCALGLIFLPLALFGGRKYVQVTYKLKESA